MSLPKRYKPAEAEPRLMAFWQDTGIYHYDPKSTKPLYVVDTPPPTVSGFLHLGHCYSYSHTDITTRFQRMNQQNIYYPIGYDDNGLPTERLVERQLNIRATDTGRANFIKYCLNTSEIAEKDYETLWRRLGLSVDWKYTYRTIGSTARQISQWSFTDLYNKGLVYRQQAPSIWCPECQTAIAQAELNTLERDSTFYTLAFKLEDNQMLKIATTRPELLPACVAIFVHPEDQRYTKFIGQSATVPLFSQQVSILADPGADPEKGTGAVMCCTFGDTDDVNWWYTHKLPLIEAIGRDGRMTNAASKFKGLTTIEARRQIVDALAENNLLLDQISTHQYVRVHERCDTPIEYIVTNQWFVRVLDFKEELLDAGEQIKWYPAQMKNRYRDWVQNLSWDWSISRQRYFGVPFPVWYCEGCGAVVLADEADLPVDPLTDQPKHACSCGSTSFSPETDVMDTWATSSLTPQIAGGFFTDEERYQRMFPMSVRPQSHEIIRTWALYTIVKSLHHFGKLPWKAVAISGWGLAPEGTGKISKSRGGGPVAPMQMIEEYSADAVRYWAASTGLGKDSVISVEKIQTGVKLVNKLWNVARFSQRFLADYMPSDADMEGLSPADRWILTRLQKLIARSTELFHQYDYAAAKSETENFFWRDLADNYLEMAKQRLYNASNPGARYTLYQVLLATIKLFAPFLPYVTEEIYQGLFQAKEGDTSIHVSIWPMADERLIDDRADRLGDVLVTVATAVRRYKSDQKLSLTTELDDLQLVVDEPELGQHLIAATPDLMSVTRARQVNVVAEISPETVMLVEDADIRIGITLG